VAELGDQAGDAVGFGLLVGGTPNGPDRGHEEKAGDAKDERVKPHTSLLERQQRRPRVIRTFRHGRPLGLGCNASS
jgi:hypothetical protein